MGSIQFMEECRLLRLARIFANKNLHYIGISGDGDSASIGLGQFCHIVRRRINMLYIVANNGTYGLTKGYYKSSDIGSTTKAGDESCMTI